MKWYRREPTLDEMLSDPIVVALMDADGVDARELTAMLRDVGRRLGANRGARSWSQWPAGSHHLAI
jgi:carbamoylphosphate synthase small subunit